MCAIVSSLHRNKPAEDIRIHVVGAGKDPVTQLLAAQGYHVYASDIDEGSVEYQKRLIGEDRVLKLNAKINIGSQTSLVGCFDVIVDSSFVDFFAHDSNRSTKPWYVWNNMSQLLNVESGVYVMFSMMSPRQIDIFSNKTEIPWFSKYYKNNMKFAASSKRRKVKNARRADITTAIFSVGEMKQNDCLAQFTTTTDTGWLSQAHEDAPDDDAPKDAGRRGGPYMFAKARDDHMKMMIEKLFTG